MASELDLRITATAMAIGSAITTKRFYTKFDVLEPPRELTGAGRERFKEAQRDKRRAHYEACAKAEREFVEGELRRVAAAGVGALHEVLNNWLPTSENINSLPEPIRRYIHDVETRCDPTGLVQENTVLKDSVAALAKRVEELEGAEFLGKGGALPIFTTPETVGASRAAKLSEQFHLHIKPGDTGERTTHSCPKIECNLQLLRFSRPGTEMYMCPQHGFLGWGYSPEEETTKKE